MGVKNRCQVNGSYLTIVTGPEWIILGQIERERERARGGMEDDATQRTQKWLEDMSKGLGQELEAQALEGLQILHAQKGLIQCDFVVPEHLSDQYGNWHAGAIATLIDDVGAAALFSFVGHIKASVNLDISYFSTAKEEVEIEAKFVGEKGNLAAVVVEIRRKSNGEMIALGKQWMASTKIVTHYQYKIVPSQVFALLLRPDKDHKYRSSWNKIPPCSRLNRIILDIFNVPKGFDILEPERQWKNVYSNVIIALDAIVVLLQAFTWYVVLKMKSESFKKRTDETKGANDQVATPVEVV